MEVKLLSCPLCLKPHFDGVDSLRETLIAAATSQISCPVCNESLMGLDKLTIHLFSHITNNIVQESLNPHTDAPIVNDENIVENIEPEIEISVDNIEKTDTIRCDICNFTFLDENILDMHQKLLHQTLEDKNTGAYSYHCHLCSKKFRMRGSLMVHLRVAHYGFGHHNDTNLNKLEIISKKLKSDDKLDENKGTTKQWSCDVCSKLFTTKYFLKKHKRLHTGEMPYYCAQCNKYFTFQQSYHKHMLYHSSEKPHICLECGRAFKELSTLHNHERIHSGERPFACETCGKCFRQRVSYLVHRRIHTGVMPYKCTACEKTFRYKVSQKSHKCPINPPGTVVRTSIPETQVISNNPTDVLNQVPIMQAGALVPILSTNNFTSPSLNTIIFNAQGEIIGQNFAFDGKSIITYDIQNNRAKESSIVEKTEIESACKDTGIQRNSDDTLTFSNESNPDFFTMVMSPSLPDVESLCLTNSPQDHKNDKQPLRTINEESLKELLYGQNSGG